MAFNYKHRWRARVNIKFGIRSEGQYKQNVAGEAPSLQEQSTMLS